MSSTMMLEAALENRRLGRARQRRLRRPRRRILNQVLKHLGLEQVEGTTATISRSLATIRILRKGATDSTTWACLVLRRGFRKICVQVFLDETFTKRLNRALERLES